MKRLMENLDDLAGRDIVLARDGGRPGRRSGFDLFRAWLVALMDRRGSKMHPRTIAARVPTGCGPYKAR